MFSYRPYVDAKKLHTILTFKNPRGALIFYDPQSSKFYDRNFLEDIAYYKYVKETDKFESSSPAVLRVDDKKLDKKTFEMISKKAR